jgi:two-component system chemotaxis response regulator CheB
VRPQFFPGEQCGVPSRKLPPAVPTHIVAIGVSTGGPNALQYLFSHLQPEFSGSIVVVQHMPEGFTELFAKRLDDCCPIQVKEAQSGDLAGGRTGADCSRQPAHEGQALASGQRGVTERGAAGEWTPSIGRRSISQRGRGISIGSDLAVLMTGMGEDGATGLGEIRGSRGIHRGAESRKPAWCIGMPKAAIERGYAMQHRASAGAARVILQAQCGRGSKRGRGERRSQASHWCRK